MPPTITKSATKERSTIRIAREAEKSFHGWSALWRSAVRLSEAAYERHFRRGTAGAGHDGPLRCGGLYSPAVCAVRQRGQLGTAQTPMENGGYEDVGEGEDR